MTKNKLINALLVMVALLFAAFTFRDWYVFYQCGAVEHCLAESSYFQHYTKFSVTVLLTILTFLTRKNSIGKRDHSLLQMAMLIAFCADVSFKILHNAQSLSAHSTDFLLLGISFFMLFQTIMIYRHTRTSDTDDSVPWIIVVPLMVAFILNGFQLFGAFKTAIVPTAAIYGAFLISSLVVGCRISRNSYFSKRSASLIKWGMILFFIGDVFVGLSLIEGNDNSLPAILATISNNFVWTFYVPALLCLIFSGYKRD